MKMKSKQRGDELREHYDLKLIPTGVLRKYAGKVFAETDLVSLAPDVVMAFPDAEAVNEALQMLVRVARKSPARSS